MKKIKIGLPRTFLYHRYSILWKKYFEKLGCKIILSPHTNQKIIELGNKHTVDECCLSYKIYIGHVIFLKDSCDYILIPRICNFGIKEKVCTRFNGTYDVIKYLLPKNKIITYNIDHLNLKFEVFEFIKMGLKINKNLLRIIISYIYAKKCQKKYDTTRENEQYNEIQKQTNKILIVSKSYNIEDNYISNYIINYLKDNDITIIYSHKLNKKIAKKYSQYFSNTLYWIDAKESIGALYYYKYMVDGIIFLSTYPCSIDSLVNNLAIYKNQKKPILNLIIDENTTNLSLETKLESFLDIIKEQKNA